MPRSTQARCGSSERLVNGTLSNTMLTYVLWHWRGELSLGKAFWLSWLLVTTILLALWFAINVAAAAGLAVVPYVFAYWMVGALLQLWWWEGVWRSAQHHTERGGKRVWAVLAKVVVILGVISTILVIATDLQASADRTMTTRMSGKEACWGYGLGTT